MFVSIENFFRRVRQNARNDDTGASLILVIAYLLLGFIVATVVAAACMAAIQQNVRGKSSVQAFAAAEAGRDAVVSALEIAPESCPATAQYTDDFADLTDPQFSVTLHPSAATVAPTRADGITQACPADTDHWVVIRSTGTAPDGRTSVVDAVYPWERFRKQIAGGGLGYVDSSYTAAFSTISGDTVIKKGDFTCSLGTVFKGNVFVLEGNVSVGLGLFGGPSCDIWGDLYVGGDVDAANLFSRLKVGGQIKVVGNMIADGRIEGGTDNARPYKDIVVDGTITVSGSGRVTTSNSGSIKATGNIQTASGGQVTSAGNLVTNANLNSNGTMTAATAVTAVQGISGNGSITATAGDMIAGGSISGSGARTAGGNMTAVLDIDGSGARTADSVLAGRNISTTGTVTASAGNIHAGGAISGGTRTASGSVLSMGDISAGTVTANGGDIITNRALTGNSNRIASRAIHVGTDITGTGVVEARGGDLLVVGNVTGTTGTRRAVGRTIAVGGNLDVGTGTLEAANVTVRGSVVSGGACTVTADLIAGTTVTFSQQKPAIGSGTICRIAGTVRAGGSGASTLPLHTATRPSLLQTKDAIARSWSTVSGVRNYIDIDAANAPKLGSTCTVATCVPVPGVPVVTVVTAPVVTTPAVFTMVLNEDPAGTWETYEDLQLRSTWVDLGTYTTWAGYYPVTPLAGASCSGTWLNPGGNITRILSSAGDVYAGSTLLAPAGEPVVIDATACGTVNMAWSTFNLARDAVILVNAATFNLAPFRATGLAAGEKRQLFVVQVDPDPGLYTPAWGGDPEPIPHCAGRQRISITGTGWGSLAWSSDVNVALYSPCGVQGTFAKVWKGHIYTHNDHVTTDILANLECSPMEITGVVGLPCDINDVTSSGSMNINAWRLGDRVSQTEP